MQTTPTGLPPPAQQSVFDPQYYYSGGLPTAPNNLQYVAAPNAFPAQQYYPEQYVIGGAAPPQQPVIMHGQPYIYMPQATTMGQAPQHVIYYPQMAHNAVYYSAAAPPVQDAAMSQQHQPSHPGNDEVLNHVSGRAPISSSTPLPTVNEYHLMGPQAPNVVQFRYHRNMEHDENLIDDISKITIDSHNDDTLSAEKDLQRGQGNRRSLNPQPYNYKTRLCVTHASGRKCDMGSRCKFAHGPEELRTVDAPVRMANNKYKTKLCKNFSRGANGFCPYGLRCEFIHPNDKEFQTVPEYMCMDLSDCNSRCDITPDAGDMPTISRSAVKSSSNKVLLKHRNVAGSMMCLTNNGRKDLGDSRSRQHVMASLAAQPPRSRYAPQYASTNDVRYHGSRSKSNFNGQSKFVRRREFERSEKCHKQRPIRPVAPHEPHLPSKPTFSLVHSAATRGSSNYTQHAELFIGMSAPPPSCLPFQRISLIVLSSITYHDSSLA
ncbi:unnamed protein product [Caenorhabditis auriculariae]|uniref:C3H1-type domain-containing protein n=1 Tax=Caenorhabditis auriculariae TaxID=2777116 RepID=A0A8S1GN11_9PELO|nr:unnamed protein product [Caenorhabditis auriculariae]